MPTWFRRRVLVASLLFSPFALSDCPQLLLNGDFETGDPSPWTLYGAFFYGDAIVEDEFNEGNLLYEFDYSEDGEERELWEAGMQQAVEVTAGSTYRLTFWARGDDEYSSSGPDGESPGYVTVADGTGATNYGLDESFTWVLGENQGGQGYTFEFTANASASALLTLFFGTEDVYISIDSISLQEISSPSCSGSGGSGSGGTGSGGTGAGGSSGGASSGGTGGGTGGGSTGGAGNTGGVGGQIHNNQLGYVSSAEKLATLVHASTSPQAWELRSSSGTVVDSGQTTVTGNDAPSGDHTHRIDFSSYETPGSGYRLWVGNAAGPAFSIGGDVYGELRRDALRFFYYQRASEAISSTYSEGAAYARDAGHTDASISCTEPSECSYELDVRYGWYDAGDYGKYVVNGGIAVWTLLNLYERTDHLGTDLSVLGDGRNNIPESTNGRSDLLDEVKRELVFLMSMQVPAGQPLAGMAHHKTHSSEWDAIPVAPEDALPHFLRPPSTAATLNLAATAAQCARIYQSTDAALATDCLEVAETAYAAAIEHPAILAPADDDQGGGNYADADVSDEFYWAAAELYITTGEQQYQDAVFASNHHAQPPLGGAAMSWPTTATLGMISLATVPSDLDDDEREAVRAALVLRAQEDLDLASEGYGISVDAFYWGSNSSVLNASLLHAVAYDLTGDSEYRSAALAGLDYVLGRNPLGQSYVSGYGVAPFQNAHHRFWAHGYSSSWPVPPPGVLAGGPNAYLDGLTTDQKEELGLVGCEPSKCWADNEEAFSLTEVTVNWNAPLAWLASWASELESDPQDTFPGVDLGATPGGSGSGGASGSGGSGNGDGGTDGNGDGGTDGNGDGGTDGNGDGGTDGNGDGGTDGNGDGGSDSSGGTDGGECTVGDEDCACYPNDTCNGDLTCSDDVCVEDDDGSDGGSDGSSEAGGGCSHTARSPATAAPWGAALLFVLAFWTRRRQVAQPVRVRSRVRR